MAWSVAPWYKQHMKRTLSYDQAFKLLARHGIAVPQSHLQRD